MLAVMFGQFLQCCQHVRHHDAAVVDTVLGVADDAESCTLLQGLWGKGVAVEFLAFEGKEKAARGDGAAVGGDSAGLQIGLV